MGRNAGDYVLYPKNIGDALYGATTPSASNPFVTQSVLNSAIGLNNELSEILANGNITDGYDIVVSTGDKISGAAELTLEAVTSVDITSSTDNVNLVSTVGRVTVTADLNVELTSTTGNIELTTVAADIKLSSNDAFELTAVSTTINTRETIWTTQGAAAIALVDAFKLYSADIIAGNAAPHFETEAGDVIKLFKGAAVADAAGGATVDAEARTAINTLLARLRVTGGNGLIAD